MKTTFKHSGKYTSDAFTVDEVIASLEAQKILLKEGVSFLAELDPDFKLEEVTIRIESLETGSLSWDFLIEVYGKYQPQLEEQLVGGFEKMFGVDVPDEYKPFVTLAVLAVSYMVMRYAYERVFRSRDQKPTTSTVIKGDGNVIIQQISGGIGRSPEFVEKILEERFTPKKCKKLISTVADFLRPAKREENARIEMKNAPGISREALAEFPGDADLKKADERKDINIEEALIDIRGTDRDRSDAGWGAVILSDSRFLERLPMDLYPDIDPENLAKHQKVIANIAVEHVISPDNSLKPKRIHLLSFKELPSEDS